MIVVLAVIAVLICVPATGGRLSGLAELRLRRGGALAAALGLQLAITTVAADGSAVLHSAAHLASYVLAGWFVWANRRVAGMPLVALGGAMNVMAIVANGGVMPASPAALRTAGLADMGS